jgi:hypothetical protein
MKMLSVNEALEMGVEVPKAMLMDYEIDHDEPGMILWSDIEPNIDIEKGIFELPADGGSPGGADGGRRSGYLQRAAGRYGFE